MSAKEGDTPKVEELLAAGADPRIKDKDGKTPLDLAKKDEVVEMLKAAVSKAAA
jgi:ankyrin repeat protein